MSKLLFAAYQKQGITDLIHEIDKDYYDVIGDLCRHASVHAAEIEFSDHQAATKLYVNLCHQLIDEIKNHLKARKESFVPYIQTLIKKSSANHDCRSCSGKCSVQHQLSLDEILIGHVSIKEIWLRIQQLTKPLYLEKVQSISYKILRNEIMIIESALNELLYIEENIIIPKVKDLQNAIHATE